MVRALALPFAVAAIAMMWTSPVAAAEPQPDTAFYAIGKCFDLALPPPQRPTRFDYNCDGTGVLQDMTWTTWGVGTDFVTIDGMPAVHFSELKPNCRPR
ncbi:hypothetical protein [Mycobacterium sp. AZCC_0083]|uniref:hypothetical protein n=1 Tax=Mycobacterium sp. AZCC_0083 TaxID=2735882 RepID=UPI0017DEE6A6|nr:hypothetical protein [Mycobacterium sp. AZCC_0083]MBB5167691.1 hypothetical protein [Mycobacterium sp. AZCC_0083]